MDTGKDINEKIRNGYGYKIQINLVISMWIKISHVDLRTVF